MEIEEQVIIEKFYQKKKFWLYVFVILVVAALVLFFVIFKPSVSVTPTGEKLIEIMEELEASSSDPELTQEEILEILDPPVVRR